MSFFTSLILYRPTEPPIVATGALSAFVRDLPGTGLFADAGTIRASLKFGRALDEDERPASWDEPIDEQGIISVAREMEWDVEAEAVSLHGLADLLGGTKETIYRAVLALGDASDALRRHVARPASAADDDLGLDLDAWSLELGPVMSYSLGSEGPFMVGWIGLSLEGHGQIWPESARELVDRLLRFPGVAELEDLCRRTWPVRAESPTRRVIKARRSMGDLWPYDRADRPWDWCWGVAESG